MKRRTSNDQRANRDRREIPVRRRWWRGTAGALGTGAIGAAALGTAVWAMAGWWSWDRVAPIPVPAIALEQAASAVAGVVTAARDKVLADPPSADAWGELGMVLLAHQFEFEANVCLEHAARLDPGEFRWPYLLGVSLAVSDPRTASNHFRRALSLRGDVPAAHLRLGELLFLLEEFDEASEHLQAAYRGDSHDPRTHYDIAQLLAARGDVAAALPWAESATQLAPQVKMVHELLANLQQRLGNHDAARAEMRLADQTTILDLEWRDPFTVAVLALRQDVTSLLDRAQSLLDQDRAADAIQVLHQALQGDDRNPTVYCLLARTLIQANRLPEAGEQLERAVQRHPQSAEVRFLCGTVAFMTQRYQESEQSFREAVRLQPDYYLAYYNLGHTLLKTGNDELALEAFATVIKLRPDYADAHTNLAKLWLRRGNNEQAAEHLRHAVQLKPRDAEARRLLDQIRDGQM